MTDLLTYNVIAKLLEQGNDEYDTTGKITVTESCSNFLKAFCHFILDEAVIIEDTSKEVEYKEDIGYTHVQNPLNSLLTLNNDDGIVYILPSHWKSSCHLINLINN